SGNADAIFTTDVGGNVQNSFLVSSLIMEESISSAQLEGANTTRRVAKEMLESEREPKNEDERMILNNYLLMKEAKRRCSEPLTIDLILDFHRIATSGTTKNDVVPGEFRHDNDVYIVDGLEQTVVHRPPDFSELSKRMKILCDFANKEHSKENSEVFIEPVVKAMILHFIIGYDHPFADGNGRTARALFYWFLLKSGYKLFEYIPISKLLKKAPLQYGEAYLRTETDDNDLTYFLYHQADIILRAIDEFASYIKQRAEEYFETLTWLEESPINKHLNFVQREILKKAVKKPGRTFTVKEVKNDFGITDNTARAYLNYLAKFKLLVRSKEGKAIIYLSPANLKERLNSIKS
ncbi:MAG: Fic family protein, partial [Parabacteroides sp.]|nr:Fic family protein [Parabacteroides sp.]